MILKLIKKLLHHFNYEVVHFSQMEFYINAVAERANIAVGSDKYIYHYEYFDGCFEVKTTNRNTHITVKRFKVSDYGSMEYARACAEELCDKLNEKP